MNGKALLAAATAAVVLGASLAVASHFGVPPVSKGGELAYVRDYDEGDLALVGSGERITATYVAMSLDGKHPHQDRVERFASRGRVADTTLFHKMDLPDGTFDNASFLAVDHVQRGLLMTQGPAACALFLNGVNAGTAVIAKEAIEMRYLVTGHFDVSQSEDRSVTISRDGHDYRVEVFGDGSISVDGGNLRISLAQGAEVRGWIDREYPATTQVMHQAFDHARQACGADASPAPEPEPEPEREPEPEPVPEPEPEPQPEPEPEPVGSDAGVEKEVLKQDDEVVVFGIVVEAFGPQPSAEVVMTDALPELGSAWFLGGADSEDCVLVDNNLTCEFGALEAGDGRSVTVTGYITEVCGELSNTAQVASAGDVQPANDQSTAVAQLEPCETEPQGADVEAFKNVSGQDDETVEFTLGLTNHGPDEAYGDGVYLNDTLPDTGSTWFLGGKDAEACHLLGNDLVCHWDTVPAGESRSVKVTGYVIGLCGELSNTATVWAENDNSPDNNAATAVASLPPCADASLNKSAKQDADSVVFTLTVSNVGEATVANVTLYDNLPDLNRTWFLGGADSEDCSLEGRSLVCTFGDLIPGEQRVVTVKAYTDRMPCGQEATNEAWLTADNDGNATNDRSSAVIKARPCS